MSQTAEMWGTYCSGMGETRDIIVKCNNVNLDLILVQKEKLIQMTFGRQLGKLSVNNMPDDISDSCGFPYVL